nr:folylpolyglutamate synthase/dihydrofolate synthase family protein [uncultured Porphyromonas sp.]
MTYQEAIEYLYAKTPVFQKVGGAAYKPGLETTHYLDTHYCHPHHSYRTIHVGGTNGKGSTSHTIAAVLQAAGYRVGLFTSPHLLDFRERIRVNGVMVSEDFVCRFVEEAGGLVEEVSPSFFELTTMMALVYFREQGVDFAVIEVGMGGRLDSTNIIQPILSIITGISKDHTQYLGDTLPQIAYEKAGIIKPSTPIIIGRADEPEVLEVFRERASQLSAPLTLASEAVPLGAIHSQARGQSFEVTDPSLISAEPLYFELGGLVQVDNLRTILSALRLLREEGIAISEEALRKGFREVTRMTGLRGRWETLSEHPTLICDTAHNEDGIRYVVRQLMALGRPLHLIFGMVSDKDVRGVLALLPQSAKYYFTAASVPRALAPEELRELAQAYDLHGEVYPSIREALVAAQSAAQPETDVIFVGGSNFLIADLLAIQSTNNDK